MTSNKRVPRLFANELLPKEDRRRVPGPESEPLLSLDAAIAFLQETQTTCREEFGGYFGPVIVSTALRKTADALAAMGIGRPLWPLDEAAMEAIGAERALSDALKWCFAKRDEQAGQERGAAKEKYVLLTEICRVFGMKDKAVKGFCKRHKIPTDPKPRRFYVALVPFVTAYMQDTNVRTDAALRKRVAKALQLHEVAGKLDEATSALFGL